MKLKEFIEKLIDKKTKNIQVGKGNIYHVKTKIKPNVTPTSVQLYDNTYIEVTPDISIFATKDGESPAKEYLWRNTNGQPSGWTSYGSL